MLPLSVAPGPVIISLSKSTFLITISWSPPAVGDVTAQSPTSILVQWDPIPHCQDINGDIIGYSVRYLALPDGPTELELAPESQTSGEK